MLAQWLRYNCIFRARAPDLVYASGLLYARSQVALGNELAREVLLRNPGKAPEYTGRTVAKREIEFQERKNS